MTVYTCPLSIVKAPVEQVWRLLAEPANYALWWDAQTQAIVPRGPAQPGQQIYARSKAFGRWWDLHIVVQSVDEVNHQLQLITKLPFGITAYNHFVCTPLDSATCRVAFG